MKKFRSSWKILNGVGKKIPLHFSNYTFQLYVDIITLFRLGRPLSPYLHQLFSLRIVSNCVKRSNLKTNKFIVANFHMRCLLISKMEKLPQYIRRNSSDYCQKLAANHAGLIYHGGFYYKTLHIELVSIGGSTLERSDII